MFDVLLQGKLRAAPDVRTSRNGNAFATFRLSVPTGKDGGYMQASCIAFAHGVIEAVQSLDEGDALAVNGEATVKTWEGKGGIQAGLDVTVHGVLTAYHLGRKREAMAQAQNHHAQRRTQASNTGTAASAAPRPRFAHTDFQQPDMPDDFPVGVDDIDNI